MGQVVHSSGRRRDANKAWTPKSGVDTTTMTPWGGCDLWNMEPEEASTPEHGKATTRAPALADWQWQQLPAPLCSDPTTLTAWEDHETADLHMIWWPGGDLDRFIS
jgi:hypothetical protein